MHILSGARGAGGQGNNTTTLTSDSRKLGVGVEL